MVFLILIEKSCKLVKQTKKILHQIMCQFGLSGLSGDGDDDDDSCVFC